ncbi:isochorismatase family protein [Bifidobacterium sp. ESL0790]|uniref:isochorismatase family protein n=1 Tax=Bifidobacterium sp. ESL0790 TaxID=2983233 RepID=UPI0023F7FE59|nr:isochorismatase family protein [Bifidobacterium sp. ESL0790]WEV71939.1 isochorismatase family protein [Bifidobacterium sp. ESL0790]
MAGKALIIVDVQPTFCEGGELGVEGGTAVAERIAQYVKAHKGDYAYIATTQDWHIEPGSHFSDHPDFVDSWPKHGVAGTPNAELMPQIAALGVEHHFKKGQYASAYSGFEGIEDNTDRVQTRDEFAEMQKDGKTLAQGLKGANVDHIDVVGLAESHCVKETALDAKKLGYSVTVFEDMTEPVSKDQGVSARKQMSEAGIELAQGLAD